MKYIVLLGILLEVVSGQEVVILDDENIEEAITKFPILMVKFYAPYCGHCKKMAEEYKRAAEEVYRRNLKYTIGELDATEYTISAKKYDIVGYPTLKLFFKGDILDYEGERTGNAILDFIDQKTQPLRRLQTESDIKEVINENSVIGLLFSPEGGMVEIFGVEIAPKLDDIKLFIVENPSLLREVGENINIYPSIIIIKDFEEKNSVLTGGELTESRMKQFLMEESKPSILPLDQKALRLVFGKENTGIFLFTPEMEDINILNDGFTKLGVELKGVQGEYFVRGGIVEGMGFKVGEFLGIQEEDLPAIYIIQPEGELKKYILDKGRYSLSYSGVKAFYEDWKAGKLARTRKSMPIPLNQTGAVFTLVGLNYQKEVILGGKDVLVKFFASWCTHCKTVYIHYIYTIYTIYI